MNNNKASASIQFLKGKIEKEIPKIKLTRFKDGRTGLASFLFEQAEVLKIKDVSNINRMIMKDEEGELLAQEVRIGISNGNKKTIEANYKWKSNEEFKRFMRFAENYAKENGLSYLENQTK